MSVTSEYHDIMLKIKEIETKIGSYEARIISMEGKIDSHISQDRGFGFKNWELLVMGLFTIVAGIIGAFASSFL